MVRTGLDTLAVMGVVTLLLAAPPGHAVDSVPTPKAQTASSGAAAHGLWSVYEQSLKHAKYIDLTHTLTPSIPLW